ncbi:MAG: hypothetical protein ACI4TW_08455 [Prevotella sp.]
MAFFTIVSAKRMVMQAKEGLLPSLLLSMTIAISAVLLSCKSDNKSPGDMAADAAKGYYDHLLAGRYAEYVSGLSGTDNIPASYHEQLVVNAKQFVAAQRQEHGGISSVNIVRAAADSVSHTADVFLQLCFGDSTSEEIIVPMVECGGKWLMR